MWFPIELKQTMELAEGIEELSLASRKGFKSKYDDFIDTISMLALMEPWKPSQVTPKPNEGDKYWADWDNDPDEPSALEGYIV